MIPSSITQSIMLEWQSDRRVSLTETSSRVIFYLYIIFLLVGQTSMFQDNPTNIKDVVTANPLNQIVDTLLPLIAFACVIPQRKKLLWLLTTEKFLTLFLLWCFCTVLWSDFPFESFKRWFRLVGSTTVILAFLVNTKSSEEALDSLKAVLVFYLPISLLAIALIPGATQWEFPAWRGLTSHKNTLGQVSLLSVLVWLSALSSSSTKRTISAWIFLSASGLLLLGARSTTTFLCVIFLGAMSIWFTIERQLQQLNVGRFVSLAMLLFSGIVVLLVSALELNVLESITGAFGKSTDFTGRTDLWEEILYEVKHHPVLGCGYGGFWVMENPALRLLYADFKFPWLPNEAHQGYLDIWNETGLVGLSLVAVMIIGYFRATARLEQASFWKWFVICLLILNIQESTLFRIGSFSGWLFTLAYLATYTDLVNRETSSSAITET